MGAYKSAENSNFFFMKKKLFTICAIPRVEVLDRHLFEPDLTTLWLATPLHPFTFTQVTRHLLFNLSLSAIEYGSYLMSYLARRSLFLSRRHLDTIQWISIGCPQFRFRISTSVGRRI